MRTAIVWLALSASASMAQTTFPLPLLPQFPQQLKEYLALSDDQVNRISAVRAQLASFQGNQFLRQYQLQAEVAQETAKPTPDPLALGLRYSEIESIRRKLQAQQEAAVVQAQAILSAGQKVKLATLQQALSLYSTACSAIDQNLMSNPVAPGTGNAIPAVAFLAPFPVACNGAIYPLTIGGVLPPPPIVLQP